MFIFNFGAVGGAKRVEGFSGDYAMPGRRFAATRDFRDASRLGRLESTASHSANIRQDAFSASLT